MKVVTEVWSNGSRRWLVIARDPERIDHLIDTNEYAMATDDEIVLTDPGGFADPRRGTDARGRRHQPRADPRALPALVGELPSL
jgi:hypothetical protein